MHSWISSVNFGWLKLWSLMTLTSGWVYNVKRIGPDTEPWGTPYSKRSEEEAASLITTKCAVKKVWNEPSQQSSKEEYKPWKWGATARYYASHTKTMLPTRKSVPRSSRQSDHTKTSWSSKKDANCSGMVMSPFIRSGENHIERHSERGKETRQTEEEVGRQHQGMDRPGVR